MPPFIRVRGDRRVPLESLGTGFEPALDGRLRKAGWRRGNVQCMVGLGVVVYGSVIKGA